ncbi:hypothetical protein EC988_007055, partial [Linderina pennispora]
MANGQVAQSARSLSAAEILAKIKQAKQPTYTEEETQPEISHVELHSFVRSHLATDIYDAISYYIRQMAMGGQSPVSISESGSASGMADMRMALRLWAEFLSWLNRQQPEIVVAYPDAAACQSAKAQLSAIIKQQIPRDHDCSKVCKGLAVVSRSLARGPCVGQIPQTAPIPDAISSTDNPLELVVSCRTTPGAVLAMRDGGVARRAAFGMFYSWLDRVLQDWGRYVSKDQQAAIGEDSIPDSHLVVEVSSSDGEGNGESTNSAARCKAAANDAVKNQDAVDVSSTIEVSASESDVAIAASYLSQQPKARTSRSIKPIRDENPEVLELRNNQMLKEQAIRRRIAK